MKAIFYPLFALIIALTMIFSCSGKRNKATQYNNNANESNIENNADFLTAITETRNSFIVSDNEKFETISLPFSLDLYLKNHSNYPAYQPTDRLISYLKKVDYEGSEYNCYLLPFSNGNIFSMLLWVCRGDNEYFLIITADVEKEEIIDSLIIGKLTDIIISFVIYENFNIELFEAEFTYNESIVNKEMINSYHIKSNGIIEAKL